MTTEDLAAEAARHSEIGGQHFTSATKSSDWQKFDKGMYDALLEYRIAESMQPEVGVYRINAGSALSRLGRYDEAVVKFREGIRLGPTKPWFHNELCVALRRLKHYDEADTECIKAVRDVNNRTFQDELENFLERAEKARAANPQIMVLDEATANLDYNTELEVKRALGTLRKDKTTIVIAHRYSMVKDAAYVYVLEAGRVIEAGIPEDLIAAGGWFAAFAASAAGAEDTVFEDDDESNEDWSTDEDEED